MPAVTDKQHLYLKRINRFEAQTADQLIRLLGYSENTYTTVTTRLANMEKRKLLIVAAKIQDTTKKISGAFKLYSIGPEGRDILEAEGIVVPRRNATRSAEYWRHSMAVTDLLITATLWAEQSPDYSLLSMLTEYDIQRLKQTNPVIVKLPSGELVRIEPDAIVRIGVNDAYFRTLVCEVERGQEENRAYSQRRWFEKIEKLIAYWEGRDKRETYVIAVIAMRGEEQARTLLKWTEMYLRENNKQYLSEHIRITATQPAQMALFTNAVWYSPGVHTPLPLFE